MSRKIILIKQELLLLVYELNRSGLLAENEKIRPILAQLEKLLLCDLSPDRKSGSAGMPRPISYAVFCLIKKKAIRAPSEKQQLTRLFPAQLTKHQLAHDLQNLLDRRSQFLPPDLHPHNPCRLKLLNTASQ